MTTGPGVNATHADARALGAMAARVEYDLLPVDLPAPGSDTTRDRAMTRG